MKDKKNQKEPETIPYLPLGMCIGLSIGVGLGAAMNNIPVFMSIGLSVGLGIGAAMDAANKKKEKAIKDQKSKEQSLSDSHLW